MIKQHVGLPAIYHHRLARATPSRSQAARVKEQHVHPLGLELAGTRQARDARADDGHATIRTGRGRHADGGSAGMLLFQLQASIQGFTRRTSCAGARHDAGSGEGGCGAGSDGDCGGGEEDCDQEKGKIWCPHLE